MLRERGWQKSGRKKRFFKKAKGFKQQADENKNLQNRKIKVNTKAWHKYAKQSWLSFKEHSWAPIKDS